MGDDYRGDVDRGDDDVGDDDEDGDNNDTIFVALNTMAGNNIGGGGQWNIECSGIKGNDNDEYSS